MTPLISRSSARTFAATRSVSSTPQALLVIISNMGQTPTKVLALLSASNGAQAQVFVLLKTSYTAVGRCCTTVSREEFVGSSSAPSRTRREPRGPHRSAARRLPNQRGSGNLCRVKRVRTPFFGAVQRGRVHANMLGAVAVGLSMLGSSCASCEAKCVQATAEISISSDIGSVTVCDDTGICETQSFGRSNARTTHRSFSVTAAKIGGSIPLTLSAVRTDGTSVAPVRVSAKPTTGWCGGSGPAHFFVDSTGGHTIG
jgi:hypothetical protein